MPFRNSDIVKPAHRRPWRRAGDQPVDTWATSFTARYRISLLAAVGFLSVVMLQNSLHGGAEPAALPALLKTFQEELVEITPGKGKFPARFVMGTEHGPWTEQPAHPVELKQAFWIAKYEVPQNLYEAIMGTNPSRWKGPRNSAENFTCAEAEQFCQKLTAQLRAAELLPADEEIRLPTEAEWEYCCRAGTMSAYSFGESATTSEDAGVKATLLSEFGWHTGNAAGNDPPVGAKRANPWGLYDMHGYLWEFVSDPWQETYAGAPADGAARKPDHGTSIKVVPRRVVRGGSWKDRYECLRSAHRRPVAADLADDAIGLRCVRAKVSEK